MKIHVTVPATTANLGLRFAAIVASPRKKSSVWLRRTHPGDGITASTWNLCQAVNADAAFNALVSTEVSPAPGETSDRAEPFR